MYRGLLLSRLFHSAYVNRSFFSSFFCLSCYLPIYSLFQLPIFSFFSSLWDSYRIKRTIIADNLIPMMFHVLTFDSYLSGKDLFCFRAKIVYQWFLKNSSSITIFLIRRLFVSIQIHIVTLISLCFAVVVLCELIASLVA